MRIPLTVVLEGIGDFISTKNDVPYLNPTVQGTQ